MKSQHPNPKLQLPLATARLKIRLQLDRAKEIRNSTHRSSQQIDKTFDDIERWTKFTHALLIQLFASDVIADEFSDWPKTGYDSDVGKAYFNPTFQQQLEFLRDNIDPKINRLTSIFERLELYSAGESTRQESEDRTQENKMATLGRSKKQVLGLAYTKDDANLISKWCDLANYFAQIGELFFTAKSRKPLIFLLLKFNSPRN